MDTIAETYHTGNAVISFYAGGISGNPYLWRNFLSSYQSAVAGQYFFQRYRYYYAAPAKFKLSMKNMKPF